MSVSLLHPPPEDLSVGIMHVRYILADRVVNIQRIHLSTDNPSAVAAAFADYADAVSNFFHTEWAIQLSALERVVAGRRRRMPCPVAADVAGVSGATATTGIAGLTQTIFTFNTEGPDTDSPLGKSRFRFVGIGGSVPARQVKVSASAGGTVNDQTLVALLTDDARFVGHDGSRLLAPATKSTPLDTRERRKSMAA